jgi:DNA processing protein
VAAAGASEPERRDWLRLARTESVGPVAFHYLVGRFGSARTALANLPELARRAGRSAAPHAPSEAEAEAELAAGAAMGARLIVSYEADYPAMLKAVDPPPPVLWAVGDSALLRRRCVAVVGARAASAQGRQFARGLAVELGAAGLVVVSGLARGIDAAAHEGSLGTGTVAVLGGGLGDIYPPENAQLYAAICEKGCVVSENEVGRKALARDFPRRNRIISGLSAAVVVVEAEQRSGSLITARLAAEQGREVLAVPGSPLDPRSRGGNNLIRQGAAVCESAEDVLAAIEPLGGFAAPAPDGWPTAEGEPSADLMERVLELLAPSPAPIDELARQAGAAAGLVFAALVELSLAGRAELGPGGVARRA